MRRLEFNRARLIGDELRRIPPQAHVEIDAQGRAFFCVPQQRLVFAATLERLVETLGIDNRALVDESANAAHPMQ